MNPVRQRRLLAEQARLEEEFTNHPRITVQPVAGDPPDQYRVTFLVRTLRWDGEQQRPLVIGRNQMLIQLPLGYPRENPRCVMETPVFHPNFGNWICMSDAWGPGQTLVDLIYQVGDMLQFRTYNISSPMNAEAARWVQANAAKLPLENIELQQLAQRTAGAVDAAGVAGEEG